MVFGLISCKSEVKKEVPVSEVAADSSNVSMPSQSVLSNEIFTDTIEFLSYDDNYDYLMLLGKKNKKPVSFIYGWDWSTNDKYNFKSGDVIVVKWKMDSIFIAGDGERLDFAERAIDAEKIGSNDYDKYTLALKEYLMREWTLNKKKNDEIGKINFKDNVLTIEGTAGFTLSTYNFNDAIISKDEKSGKVQIIIYNEGGGAGGNVVVLETYVLTATNASNFHVEKEKTELLN